MTHLATTLATRLRRLLDVLQQCHGVKRSVALRLIADACGVSHRYVNNIATGNVRILGKDSSRVEGVALRSMEARYAAQLCALVAFETECARYLERQERAA